MDWANEKYVRLFIRDTTTWKLLPWQARALLPLILRKLDRSGVMDLGSDGEDGLAAVIEVPLEFLQAGLPALLKRDVFRMLSGKLVMPNFMAAQEARQSDAQRKRESRENQRLAAMRSQAVTDSTESSQSHSVTTCHASSDSVTPDYPQTRPDQTRPRENPPARDPGTTDTEVQAPVTQAEVETAVSGQMLLVLFGQVRSEVFPGTLPWVTARDAKGDAGSFAAMLGAKERADVRASMRLALEHIRDGIEGWADPRLAKDPSFAFGAWKSGFHGLREELAGKSPRPKQAKQQPHASWGKPVTMADVEAAKARSTR